jgi:hypothetical protein
LELPENEVTAKRQAGLTQSASESPVLGETFNERHIARAGEVLEVAPGLIVTQH